ncbi:MAG: cardiolipin synthase [Gemmataceae bacterium]|nr:cardiolipin synthase [Gemmataceae bacterium]
MAWLLDLWDELSAWLPALLTLTHILLVAGTLIWALMIKTNTISAVAWCLVIIFLPFIGPLMFFVFGYQHVHRPLKRKRRHKARYQMPPHPADYAATHHPELVELPDAKPVDLTLSASLATLAARFGASSVTVGNQIDFYDDGAPAIGAMLEAVRNARHHVHLEFFIWQPDELGRHVLEVLAERARQGIEVRLLYDGVGSRRLSPRLLRPLREAGGKSCPFLPLNPWRRRVQINMRNHRKILVVDGQVGFIGGLNIGDEYLGKDPCFGYWRDTHLRIRGPAVCDLQRVFCEDWDFAADEHLSDQGEADGRYFRAKSAGGPYAAQIIDSGPDKDLKAIREVTFAAIAKARRRVWIASPYFVPDTGLLDALRLAAYSGIDVRLLGLFCPDHWVPYYAARYWWTDMLSAGVQVYQYAKGMMHAKVMVVDDEFASVGTANLDNRSMYLSFEVNCLLYSNDAVKRLEESFLRDFQESVLLDRDAYATRPFAGRLLENACRLASPIL